MAVKVYIDGQEGTTGLKILERFEGRNDIELLRIDEDKRKDPEERKKLILSREFEKYVEKSKEIKKEVSDLMEIGKELIRNANIDIGLDNLINISYGVKIDDYIDIKNVTLMGTEIPSAVHKQEIIKRNYGFYNTSNTVDEALFIFNKIQDIDTFQGCVKIFDKHAMKKEIIDSNIFFNLSFIYNILKDKNGAIHMNTPYSSQFDK